MLKLKNFICFFPGKLLLPEMVKSSFSSVKINKQKPHLKWSWRLEERILRHLSFDVHYWPCEEEKHFASPTGSDHQIDLNRRSKDSSSPTAQPMRDGHNAANEKSLYFKLPVSSNRLFVDNGPSQVHQRGFPPLLLWTCVWLAIGPQVPNCNSSLFPNKPILPEKYLFVEGEQLYYRSMDYSAMWFLCTDAVFNIWRN